MSNEQYWNQQIAFDCPITNKRHTIDYCFKNCEMWGRRYLDVDGRCASYLFCYADAHGKRFLHDGKATRDN